MCGISKYKLSLLESFQELKGELVGDSYLEHGRLQPKKSYAFRACFVQASEFLFCTTLPAVSGDGQIKW